MEDSTCHAILLGRINAMTAYEFIYDSKFPNPLINRNLINNQTYIIQINSHTTGTHNRFLMTGIFNHGYSSISFGGEILEKILTIGNPPQFEKIL
jgi:hypothetical protein